MQITKETKPKNVVELTIELTDDELQPYLNRAAQRVSARGAIKGFRPGKAPRDVVVQKYGEQVFYEEAAQLAVEMEYPKAVEQEQLMTLGQPKIEVKKVAPNNPFVFTATVALLPEITLGDYTSLKEKPKEVDVEEKRVDETLEELRAMRATEMLVARPAQNTDKVEIDYTLSLDNVPIDDGKQEKFPVILGSGQLVPGFEEKLLGITADEERTFTVNYPKTYPVENIAGRDVTVSVKCHSVFNRTLPKLDDAFVKDVAKEDTIDALRKRIRDNIQQEGEMKEHQRYEIALLDELIGKSTFGELPDVLLEHELDKMVYELKSQVEHSGLPFADYLNNIKKTEPEVRNGLKDQAVRRVKSALVLRTIADKEHIHPTDKELEDELTSAREQYEGDEESIQQVDSPEYKNFVRTYIVNRKVLTFLAEKAQHPHSTT